MVLGETQILGQVREAYEAARRNTVAGKLLHPLFQRAIKVGKEVMHDTSLADGRLSVASVAVEYAKQIFEHFGDKTVLSIGAGKMSQLVLKHFRGLSPGRMLVCNRDAAKAGRLAADFDGEPVPYERLTDHLVAADVVVSSTGAPHPILTRTQFEHLRRLRRGRPIFLIDIAVPRHRSVGRMLENVYLYNLDDLQKVVHGTRSQRSEAVEAARRIVLRHVEEFSVWQRQREIGPTIDRLYRHYHRIARAELDRTTGKLSNLTPADQCSSRSLCGGR